MSETVEFTLNIYKTMTCEELEHEIHRLEEHTLHLLQLYKSCKHVEDRAILQEKINTTEFYIQSLQSMLYMKHM